MSWQARRVALPSHIFKIVLDHYHSARTPESFEFVVWAIYQNTWLIEMSNPYFEGSPITSTVVNDDDDGTVSCEIDLAFSNGLIRVPLKSDKEFETGEEIAIVICEDKDRPGNWAAEIHES